MQQRFAETRGIFPAASTISRRAHRAGGGRMIVYDTEGEPTAAVISARSSAVRNTQCGRMRPVILA
jgi:hypothetical protein